MASGRLVKVTLALLAIIGLVVWLLPKLFAPLEPSVSVSKKPLVPSNENGDYPKEALRAALYEGGNVSSEEVLTRALDPKIREIYASIDPMEELLVNQVLERTEAEIREYNELHVLPWNPVTHFDCEMNANDIHGYRVDSQSCVGVRESSIHPYYTASLEEVRELAYADATAAFVAGQRVPNPAERFEYFVRAVALSGKPGDLLTLSYTDYRNKTVFINGEAVTGPNSQAITAKYRYVLEEVARRMGDSRAKPAVHRLALQQFGNEHELRSSEHIVVELIAKINRIRSEVFGAAPIAE